LNEKPALEGSTEKQHHREKALDGSQHHAQPGALLMAQTAATTPLGSGFH